MDVLMTEVVKAFQKHGFGFTKASTDSCSATALSASPAALHATLSSYSQVFLGYISPILRALALTSPQEACSHDAATGISLDLCFFGFY